MSLFKISRCRAKVSQVNSLSHLWGFELFVVPNQINDFSAFRGGNRSCFALLGQVNNLCYQVSSRLHSSNLPVYIMNLWSHNSPCKRNLWVKTATEGSIVMSDNRIAILTTGWTLLEGMAQCGSCKVVGTHMAHMSRNLELSCNNSLGTHRPEDMAGGLQGRESDHSGYYILLYTIFHIRSKLPCAISD